MTLDKKHKILEFAAKACGAHKILAYTDDGIVVQWSPILRGGQLWNPIDNPPDTANMCAKLDIDTYWFPKKNLVLCCCDKGRARHQHDEKHDGTPEGKEAAWRLAATMVAAKFGGYEE